MSSVVSRLQICQPRWRWFPRWRYAVRCIAQEADDYIESLEARVQELEAERDRLVEALTPSGDTKAAYIGEFKFVIASFDEDGYECPLRETVPWTTIKEIMAKIRERAGVAQ